MADLGVVHADVDAGGGAEAVAVHTIAALLQRGHDVTLYTTAVSGPPNTDSATDVPAFAAGYGVTLPDLDALSVVRVTGPTLTGVDLLASVATPLGITDLPLLRQAVFERLVTRRSDGDHDQLICTHGEFSVDGAVEYIHFPYFSKSAMQTYDTRFDEQLYPTYHRVCRGMKHRSGTPARTLTNSAWTAEVIETTLGREATVVHPPVDTEAFNPPSWADREPGFVALGRIHPLKRQHMLVDIIDELRERGFETHLHVVGPVGSDDYAAALQERAATRSYLHIEGRLPRTDVVRLLETHRYGLHGRRLEHFGIAVAEMVAAGMLPFVHASGGQQAVVGDDRLCYPDRGAAIDRVVNVLDSPTLQATLRDSLVDQADSFSISQFRHTIEEHITATL